MGKGEIAGNEQFLLFLQCFLPIWISFCQFSSNLKLSSANSFSLEESKICCLGKGIASVYPKYCDYNNWNFPRRTFSFNTGKFTFNGMLFNAKYTAKFCHSVSLAFWCLFIGPPSNLPDMTGGPMVFREVHRSVKQIKIVSYARQKNRH